MSDWITWSPCSVSCGMGTRSRERYVKQFPEDGSMCKVPTEETEKCVVNEECCKYFIHLCKIQPVAAALPKPFFFSWDLLANNFLCPFWIAPSSCLVTEWGEWDECSASCGMGMKRRHRMIKMTPADGSMCKAETTEAEKCMMPECRKYPGLYLLCYQVRHHFLHVAPSPSHREYS